MKIRFAVAVLASSVLFSAQAAAQVPSSAEPSRAAQQITPIDRTAIPVAPTGLISGSAAVAAPEGSEKITFTLKSLNIEGVTVYPEARVENLYKDMIGTTVSLADVYGVAQRLTVQYRNDGYILTQVVVPEQTISGGNVRLRVVEGYVDRVSIEGATRDKRAFLQGFAEKIRAERPLRAQNLERYVLLMNDIAGVSARAILSPSPTLVGASDITLVIDDSKVFDVFGQVDNRGTRYLGPLQVNAGTRINNGIGFNEGISLQAVTAFSDMDNREMDYAGFSWSQPLNHEGTKLSFGGSITSTDPGFDLSASEVEGLSRSLNLELFHPFIRTRNNNLFGALKFNYMNSVRKDNLGLGDTKDRLRVVRLAGTYQLTDRWVGINTVNAELSKGLGILGASDEGDTNMTRADGDPQFFKATLEISRLQRLTSTFDVFVSASGQTSPDTLLASEEFGVGGLSYGSAYDNSEITGEDGIAGRVELRANNLVQTPAEMTQVYGFYDIGKVWDEDNALSADRQRSIASAGLGLRASINENFAGTFEIAKPLTRRVSTENDKDIRFFGSLTTRF